MKNKTPQGIKLCGVFLCKKMKPSTKQSGEPHLFSRGAPTAIVAVVAPRSDESHPRHIAKVTLIFESITAFNTIISTHF